MSFKTFSGPFGILDEMMEGGAGGWDLLRFVGFKMVILVVFGMYNYQCAGANKLQRT
jgi:hypothetical protein